MTEAVITEKMPDKKVDKPVVKPVSPKTRKPDPEENKQTIKTTKQIVP